MKKRFRNISAIVYLLIVTLLSGTICFAADAEAGAQPLSIEEGQLSDERMMEAIEGYLNSKTLDAAAVADVVVMSAEIPSLRQMQ